MEKKKPTIDEIYKLNVDGLFESTANWFDNAFKKSQAEINRDLYNKINGYSSSSESTGGNVSLGPLLTSLNGSNLYPSRGYLYYNGNDWEFNTPTVSGGEGGVVDTAAITKIVNDTIKNVSWWGQKINNNKVDGNIVITKGSHSFTIELDDNGNLKFNGNIYATGGITALGVGTTTGGGSGVSLGTLLTQLNNENPFPTANGQVLTYDGSNFVWKTPTSGSGVALSPVMNAMNNYLGKTTLNTPQFLYWDGSTYTWKNESEISGGSGSIQVAQTPEYSGESESWVSATKLRFIGITGTKPTIRTNSNKGCVDVGIPTGGGSGSSGTTAGKLYFLKDTESNREAYWNGESNFRIIFGSGLNVSWDSTTQITLSATGGSSTGGSVDLSSYLTKTEASTTYAAKSHTHSAASITDFEDAVKGIKVNNAAKADKANELNSAVTLWGNRFYGSNNIGTTSSHANLRYVNNIYAGDVFDIKAGNNSLLKVDGTPNVSVAYGYGSNENAILSLYGNKTKIYTNGQNYHFDFVRNVFDVNSNQIHFGSETNGGKISWDAANNAFKIEGNVYATGGITALGVSNNATTSNNVDFTFRSVTSPTYKFNNGSYLTETSSGSNSAILKLYHAGSNQYILLNNQYENISNDIFLGTIIDSNCMSFMNADWYYFDNSLVTPEIYTNKIIFYNTDGNQGDILNDIAISKVSSQTRLIFTINDIQYYVNAN